MSGFNKDKSSYNIWHMMKQRCNNPNAAGYKNYGGRGIKVCERWNDFKNFYADMGDRPEGMTLDRIDNNKEYSPENCRWASWKDQHKNTRKSVQLFYKGKNRNLAEISRLTGLSENLLSKRIKRGWRVSDIIKIKPMKNGPGRKSYTERNNKKIAV